MAVSDVVTTPRPSARGDGGRGAQVGPLACPFDVHVGRVAAFVNGELPDHPVYEGFELQWFDDPTHGTGMLAFLQRRDDARVDYYVQPGLRLDRTTYVLGGGTGAWVEHDFEVARLEVGFTGVDAEARFTDVDGRLIELRFDDRASGTNQRGVLLAPVSDGIERPTSLMLVYVHGFDLLHRVEPEPVVRIDGQPVSTGALPGRLLHRRHLVKYGAPLTVATICRARTVATPLPAIDPSAPGDVRLDTDGRRIVSVSSRQDGGAATLVFAPPFPDLTVLEVGHLRTGTWHVDVDDVTITGGTWHALRRPGDRVDLGLDVTERWQPPAGLPLLIRLVTRVVPIFRRWPTSYRWRAEVALGDEPTMTSRWQRTEPSRGETYRRLTAG